MFKNILGLGSIPTLLFVRKVMGYMRLGIRTLHHHGTDLITIFKDYVFVDMLRLILTLIVFGSNHLTYLR